MSDVGTFAGVLLVIGPVVGAIPIANPSLIRIWSMSRADHIATVGRHRRAWALLNTGFAFATIMTTAGLVGLAQTLAADPVRAWAVAGATAAYAMGGTLWCAALAIRTQTTPALADMGGAAADRPASMMLATATASLFDAFVLITGAALACLGATLLAAGGVAAPVAAFTALVGLGAIAWLERTGDIIPAILYVPTLLIGVALLVGWT